MKSFHFPGLQELIYLDVWFNIRSSWVVSDLSESLSVH